MTCMCKPRPGSYICGNGSRYGARVAACRVSGRYREGGIHEYRLGNGGIKGATVYKISALTNFPRHTLKLNNAAVMIILYVINHQLREKLLFF